MQRIIDAARAARLPVVAIVNSHWHLDHVSGNAALRDAYPHAQVYASNAIAGAMRGFLADYREQLQAMLDKAPADSADALGWREEIARIDSGAKLFPTIPVMASQPLTLAGRPVQLGLETNAVSGGDVWMLDRRTGVLAAGDLVTLPAPLLDTACADGWREALGRLDAVGFTTLVPGHGAPMDHAGFKRYRAAFDNLLTCAAGTRILGHVPRPLAARCRRADRTGRRGAGRYAAGLLHRPGPARAAGASTAVLPCRCTALSKHRHQQVRAVLTMLAAVAVFSMMDAGLKRLSAHYPPFQVAALRGAASLPLVLAWALSTAGLRPLVRVRWPMHLLRGAMGVAMMASFVYALRTLPLATAYSIFFIAPLLITALSVPFLGERVGPRRWIAIAVGLLGVVVLLRPSGEGMLSLAAVAVLLAALMYAVSAITVQLLARTDSTQAMVVWMMVMMTVGAGTIAWPHWEAIRADDLWVIAGVGVAGAHRPVRDHRSLPPRRGVAARSAGIHRADLGRAARRDPVGCPARFDHLDRRGDHHRQRPVPDAARTRARRVRTSLMEPP